jgi:hypothetical protein
MRKDNHLISFPIGRLPGTLFHPWQFLDVAGLLKKDYHLIPILSGDYWEDGTVFRPERFLDAAGAKKDDHLISNLSGRLLGRWNSVSP